MSDCDNANCKCGPVNGCSLQQWMESCSAGRNPTCHLCKRSISCPAHDVHRLDFQSVWSDSTEPQVSPSRNLQTAVEDPQHVNSSSAFCKLSKLTAALTIIKEKYKELESQVAVNLQRSEKAEAATVVGRSELAQCMQDLTNLQEELMCLSLELEEIGAMEKVQAADEQAPWDIFFGLFGFCVKIWRIGIF